MILATPGLTKRTHEGASGAALGDRRCRARRRCGRGICSSNLLGGKTGGPVQMVNAPADMVARGKYLAEAADCAACHTAPGGAPFAGGLAMESGFGTIYATNITPDPDYGIGPWSADDFWRALHDGMRRDGQQLYPAMPYTSYRGMTREDADAIYAYLMQPGISVANAATEPRFPAQHPPRHDGHGTCCSCRGAWPQPERKLGRLAARGRYLVNVLGHCGECHTPRNFMMAMKRGRHFQGGIIEGVEAPDIPRHARAGGIRARRPRAFHAARCARRWGR